jgi:hypothetical protein
MTVGKNWRDMERYGRGLFRDANSVFVYRDCRKTRNTLVKIFGL